MRRVILALTALVMSGCGTTTVHDPLRSQPAPITRAQAPCVNVPEEYMVSLDVPGYSAPDMQPRPDIVKRANELALKYQGKLEQVFWIAPSFLVRISDANIERMAWEPDIASITQNMGCPPPRDS